MWVFQVITPLYNPWGPHQSTPFVSVEQTEWASISASEAILPGDSVSFTIRVHNRDTVARTFFVAWKLNFATNGAWAVREIAAQDGQPYLLDAGETRDFVVSVPWMVIQPGINPDRFIRAEGSVVCEEANVYWTEDSRIRVSTLPVTLTAIPSGTVRFNDVISLDLRFRNTGSEPALGTLAELSASRRAKFATGETAVQVNLGTVAGGADVHILRAARTTEKGPLTIIGRVLTNNLAAQTVGVRVNVVGCLGDLDGGDSVDDADFSLFAQSYNAFLVPPGDPAADLNQDGIIDDMDFTLFVQAYDQLACD